MPKLTFKFDPNQEYQIDAIQSTVGLFEGLPRYTTDFRLSDEAVANLPRFETLSEEWLYDNLRQVQEDSGIPSSMLKPALEVEDAIELEGVSASSWRYPSFSVEMETGTGKTYVYLRTIHELRKQYGFGKFIIVVPSLAIYEGVCKSFEVTKGHFATLYGNETVNLVRYDGSRLSQLRNFAASTFVEIMVMTLASFNGVRNTIYRASESLPGERLPYQYIQDTRPILILDEPQNMESARSKEALRTLHPLFALRYSATHRSTPNLVYRLTPFDAYRLNLVKKIQVDGVIERDNVNQSLLALDAINTTRRGLQATLRTVVREGGGAEEGTVTLYQGDDLAKKTMREEHAGYTVREIHAGDGYVAFENGERLELHETQGPAQEDIFRVQIRRTIQEHMQRQHQLEAEGIKVLSLFFIDRVANYVNEDGIIRRLFDEEYARIAQHYERFRDLPPSAVRDGYFAKKRAKKGEAEVAIDTTSRTKAEREAERRTFELIMRNKERLLSFEEPVCFIFAHSALKEGWDNPNVFQICTLNQTRSDMKKRQEIGRGLRLAVNQSGERVFDEDVNVLTVVANESYEQYVSLLQTEYVEAGQLAPPKPTRAGKAMALRNDAIYQSKEFRRFWDRLAQRTTYDLHVDTDALVALALERLANDTTTLRPVIVVERGMYVVTEYRLTLQSVSGKRAQIEIKRADTAGSERIFKEPYNVRDDLAKLCKDDRLRGFKITKIEDGDLPTVTFGNGQELTLGDPLYFSSESGQKPVQRGELAPEHNYPVMNLLERAAAETGLTRATLNRIYRMMPERKKRMILVNPEGFCGWFTNVVRNALADHLVDNMRFVVTGGEDGTNLEALFPATKQFPQKELVTGGQSALYDQVQVDSDVEDHFVRHGLRGDAKVICYFKLPPTFKIPLPKIVGNYNPDWGILRWNEHQDKMLLQLVRETKGAEDPRRLRFAHEKRKVRAAAKHFDVLGVDYRVVTDATPNWWEPEEG